MGRKRFHCNSTMQCKRQWNKLAEILVLLVFRTFNFRSHYYGIWYAWMYIFQFVILHLPSLPLSLGIVFIFCCFKLCINGGVSSYPLIWKVTCKMLIKSRLMENFSYIYCSEILNGDRICSLISRIFFHFPCEYATWPSFLKKKYKNNENDTYPIRWLAQIQCCHQRCYSSSVDFWIDVCIPVIIIFFHPATNMKRKQNKYVKIKIMVFFFLLL